MPIIGLSAFFQAGQAAGFGAASSRWFMISRRINKLGWVALLAVAAGCASREKRQQELLKAYEAGQQKARAEWQARMPMVTVRGTVRRPQVPWMQGLTLARAIIAAEHYGRGNPKKILVTRQGQVYEISPQKLLSGEEDPELEAGDLVELVE